jgi:hypothetical protein
MVDVRDAFKVLIGSGDGEVQNFVQNFGSWVLPSAFKRIKPLKPDLSRVVAQSGAVLALSTVSFRILGSVGPRGWEPIASRLHAHCQAEAGYSRSDPNTTKTTLFYDHRNFLTTTPNNKYLVIQL